MSTLPEAPPQKRRGCFFYGCIISVILLVVVALTLFFGVRYAMGKFNRMIAEYTDTTAMPIPKSDMAADDLKKLEQRVDDFNKAMQAHTNTSPLILTGPEINALINNSSGMSQFKDKIFVNLEGDEIKGQVSLPLDNFLALPMVDTKGRYLNGGGTFKAAISNGTLSVFIESLEVRGKKLPSDVMAVIQKQNLAESQNRGPNAPQLQQYDSVQVKDSKLIVQPKKE